jgi:drug/metabolite transporter (DMT)-like permease
VGAAACLASAVAFGLLAVLARLAADEGVGLDALLLVRFGLAGAVLLAVAAGAGRLRGTPVRVVVAGLLMGAVGYAAQSGLYLSALGRVEASLVALLFCGYPLLVMVVAVLVRREQPSRRRAAALVVALAGVAMVLGGASTDGLDLVGALCAVGSAVVYTGYIVVGDRVAAPDPLVLAALVCCGAFLTFAGWSVLRGAPDLALGAAAWLWLVLIALVCTVGAIVLFLAGLARVGPTAAALLSVVEPVVTVGSAALVLGETTTAQQLLGGVLVLGAVVLVQWRRRGSAADAAATPEPAPAGARAG